MLFKAADKRHVKVVDFGIAGKCQNNKGERSDAGTIKFMPPEMHSGENNFASPGIDVWALGVILFCMLFGQYPFDEEDEEELIKTIIESELEIPTHACITQSAKDLLRRMLTKKPDLRINMCEIETHGWFQLDD